MYLSQFLISVVGERCASWIECVRAYACIVAHWPGRGNPSRGHDIGVSLSHIGKDKHNAKAPAIIDAVVLVKEIHVRMRLLQTEGYLRDCS